jgi:hypothetical protein
MMTRGQLQTLIQQWSHRTDLGSQVDQFIDATTERLQRRLGITLDKMPGLNDSNLISQENPTVYLYGSLREMAIYTADAPAEREYDMLYEKEVNNLNINYNGAEWDNTTPYMRTEAEQEIEDAT